MLAIRFGRPLLAAKVPFFASDAGGTFLSTVAAPASILAGLAVAGTPITASVVGGTLGFVLTSAQVYTIIRRLVMQQVATRVAAALREKGAWGRLLAPFIERPFGYVLDALRSALVKRLQGTSTTTTASKPLTAAPAPAPAPSPAPDVGSDGGSSAGYVHEGDGYTSRTPDQVAADDAKTPGAAG
jgi:hypothetical protein